MSLSSPFGIFGIHSFTPYSLLDGMPFGPQARVLGQLNVGNSIEEIPLNGGSSRDPWASELGARTSEISLSLREYPSWIWELFSGKAITATTAEAAGGVTTLLNVKGTSAKSATIGVASVSVKTASEADVKYGIYIVKVVSPTTVDVYAMTDVDFGQGAFLDFANDAQKITATPLTITMGTAVAIPSFGLELTGGNGTIGMTVGDTAWFQARPINSGFSTVSVGTKDERFTSFGALVAAQRQSNGEMVLFNFYKLKGTGNPANMQEKAWSEYELTLRPVRGASIISLGTVGQEGLYDFQRLTAVNS